MFIQRPFDERERDAPPNQNLGVPCPVRAFSFPFIFACLLLLEGPIVLNDLFQQGIGVKVLEGIAAGEHTERSFILALALAEDRRRDIVRKTKNGLEAARKQGKVGGRRPVVDDDKRAAILDRRRRGESIRTIAAGVKVSTGVVHKPLTAAAEVNPADQTPTS
ncbi:hypothetical protein ABT061_45420 [Streptosporangium sp. NPDC002544]|uniref:hypothetical protein n=1 Tax=Streptosporangium sp. NPDC002544 TaxID=3154538 RepID=UPI00331BA48F